MPKNTEREFWERTARVGDCLEWTGTMFSDGYGAFRINGNNRRAHRLSWEFTNGPIPGRLLVCHKCDNRRCVKPGHLFLGTAKDNADDMVRKGRASDRRGEKNQSAVLSEKIVLSLREMHASGKSMRSIARELGLNAGTVRAAVIGANWGWLRRRNIERKSA